MRLFVCHKSTWSTLGLNLGFRGRKLRVATWIVTGRWGLVGYVVGRVGGSILELCLTAVVAVTVLR